MNVDIPNNWIMMWEFPEIILRKKLLRKKLLRKKTMRIWTIFTFF